MTNPLVVKTGDRSKLFCYFHSPPSWHSVIPEFISLGEIGDARSQELGDNAHVRSVRALDLEIVQPTDEMRRILSCITSCHLPQYLDLAGSRIACRCVDFDGYISIESDDVEE